MHYVFCDIGSAYQNITCFCELTISIRWRWNDDNYNDDDNNNNIIHAISKPVNLLTLLCSNIAAGKKGNSTDIQNRKL